MFAVAVAVVCMCLWLMCCIGAVLGFVVRSTETPLKSYT